MSGPAIIIQARMTSTRLPGKILMPILGKPMLLYQLERLQQVRNITKIIIATTHLETDDPVVELCESLNLPCYRGDEQDVLCRYYDAAVAFNVDSIVRVTADCPLIDPEVVENVIAAYRNTSTPCDYVSNTLERTYPRGLDVEVFSFTALESAYREARLLFEREHVTPFIYHRPERFRIRQLIQDGPDLSQERWTVDTPEDFAFAKQVLSYLGSAHLHHNYRDIMTLLDQFPNWRMLNAGILQKNLEA